MDSYAISYKCVLAWFKQQRNALIMSQQKIDLELFKEEGLTSEEDIKVVTIFETAFDSLSKTSLDELAKSTALELQQLMSPDMTADKQEYFFECTWEVLIGIAKHVPHRHDAQHLLVAVVQVLRTTPQWEDLPHFGRCMRDNWIGWSLSSPPFIHKTY